MVETKNQVEPAAPSDTPTVPLPAGLERRRPGRRKHVDQALIPLLRRTPDLDPTLPAFDLEEEWLADRTPLRGIVIGLVVLAVLWAAGIAIVAFVLS